MGLENVAMVKVKKMKIKGGIERSGPSILGAIGEAALSTPLPSPRYWTPKHFTGKIKCGSFYEIDHSKLPSTVRHVLRSIRVVLVTAKTEMNVTVRYPSTKSLDSYLESGDDGALKFRLYPSLDEKFVMGPILAVEVLGRVISSEEFGEHKLARSFWLIDCFSPDKLPSPVSVCDVPVPPEVKKGPLLLDLQSQLKGWGSQRVVAYLPDSPEEMDVGAHSEEMSVHDHSEEMSLRAHPEGMSVHDHPERKSVCAHPDEMSVHDHPEEMTVPDHPDRMSEPAHPEGMSVPAHREEDKRTVKKEEETIVIKDRIIIPYTRKRKRGSPVAEETKKIKHSPKEEPVECKAIITRNKNQGYVQRWPTKRYEAAARQLCEVLEANRAVHGNPFSRCKLRAHARTRIGDTGLLDHLLKHLAGKVIPGGDKRLRRRCDANGKMEYWLESADLAQIRKEAGVQDPYWTPPPGWKLGDCVGPQGCLCGEERNKRKEEVSSLKRQIEALKSKNVVERAIALVRQDSPVSFGRQNSGALMLTGSKRVEYEALLKKQSLMEKQLLEISQALMGVEEDMKMLLYPYLEEPGKKISPDKEHRSEAAEEASDDAEGERADSRLKVRLRVRKLKPCEHQDNFSSSPSQAVGHKEKDHLVLTADWTPPGSTTTSLTTH